MNCEECLEGLRQYLCLECDQLLCSACHQNIHKSARRKSHHCTVLCGQCDAAASGSCIDCAAFFCWKCSSSHQWHATKSLQLVRRAGVYWDLTFYSPTTPSEVAAVLDELGQVFDQLLFVKMFGRSVGNLTTGISQSLDCTYAPDLSKTESLLVDMAAMCRPRIG